MVSLNIALSLTILVLFFIVIMVGYVYVNESRKSSEEAKAAIKVVNKTENEFLQEWSHRQAIDNVRFNKTLDSLAKTYNLIVENQHLIINLSESGSHNTQRNLNLTKVNKEVLSSTNDIVREIAKQLNITGIKPLN